MNILAGQDRCPFCRKTEFVRHLHAHCLRAHPLSYAAACRYFDKMLVLLKEQEAAGGTTVIGSEEVAEIESLNGDWHVEEWTALTDQLKLEAIDSDEDSDLDKYDSPQSPDPEPLSAASQSDTDASANSNLQPDSQQPHVVKIGLRQHVKCQLCSETFTMASHAVTHHMRDHLREGGMGVSRRRLQAAYARDERVEVALLRCTLCKTTFLERADRRHECPTRPGKKSCQSLSIDRRNSSTRSGASHSSLSRSRSSSSSSCSCSSCSSTSSSSKNPSRHSRRGPSTLKNYDSRTGNRARWCIHGPLKFCKFWRLGNCRNGARCGYAHSLCPKDGRCEDEHCPHDHYHRPRLCCICRRRNGC